MAFASLFFLLLSSAATTAPPPKTLLWSWQEETDLTFLKDDPGVGVAYLALTLQFEGRDKVTPFPRMTPLKLSPTTWTMPVIRLETNRYVQTSTVYSDAQRKLAVRMILEMVRLAHARAVQIDFDALPPAQPFYRLLLSDLRSELGPDVFLSMTALVYWCETYQSWLDGLPVDEVVPMAFDMGQNTAPAATLLERGGTFAATSCRGSLGLRYAPVIPVKLLPGQRIYLFAQPNRWTPETVRSALKALQR